MPTRFFTTPEPPRMLTPAANDHAISTVYTGMRAIFGRWRALSSAAMTSGKSVYPMMQIDWKKELRDSHEQKSKSLNSKDTYMCPPRSLICVVTTASPTQTNAKTPEKTVVFCLLEAVIDSSELRSRQNINGPLDP